VPFRFAVHGFWSGVAQLSTLGRLRAMKIFPKSSEDWSELFVVSLRAYVLLAFLGGLLLEKYWPQRHGGGAPDCMLIIIVGYIVCFFAFAIGWLSADDKKVSRLHFIFMLITFFIGLYSLRYLASA
jgi:hypothetical protein